MQDEAASRAAFSLIIGKRVPDTIRFEPSKTYMARLVLEALGFSKDEPLKHLSVEKLKRQPAKLEKHIVQAW